MAINYETILSSYDDRLTLLEFMNRVLDALENASVDATHFSSLGNGQYTFSIDFADGSSVESAPVTINGAKGVSSFSASNGVLTIGLTDGSSVTANPFNGDISISGSLDVSGPVSVSGDISVGGDLHVVTQLDVDDESDFAGHVEMHNGLHIINTDLTVDGAVSFLNNAMSLSYDEDEAVNILRTDASVRFAHDLDVDNGNFYYDGDKVYSSKPICTDDHIETDVIEPVSNDLRTLSIELAVDGVDVRLTPDYAKVYSIGSAVIYRFRGIINFSNSFSPSSSFTLLNLGAPDNIVGTDFDSSVGSSVIHSGHIPLLPQYSFNDPEFIDYIVYEDDGTIAVDILPMSSVSFTANTDYTIDICFTLLNCEGQSFE